MIFLLMIQLVMIKMEMKLLRMDYTAILTKKKAIFTKVGEYLGLSRQTVGKHFKDLENGQKNDGTGLNLIRKLENGDYEIAVLDAEVATLIDNNTLRVLTSACNEHTISIYVYLFSRWNRSR